MAVNIELLNKVMEHIEGHPEEHYQGTWARRTDCGTAYCFAGHAVVICGWDPIFPIVDHSDRKLLAKACSRDGRVHAIQDVAELELGLTEEMANRLFHHRNSREQLREMVDQITLTGDIP